MTGEFDPLHIVWFKDRWCLMSLWQFKVARNEATGRTTKTTKRRVKLFERRSEGLSHDLVAYVFALLDGEPAIRRSALAAVRAVIISGEPGRSVAAFGRAPLEFQLAARTSAAKEAIRVNGEPQGNLEFAHGLKDTTATFQCRIVVR